MQERTKQRFIGALVIIGALFIILPFLFHNERPSADQALSASASPTPAIAVALPSEATKNNAPLMAQQTSPVSQINTQTNALPNKISTPVTTLVITPATPVANPAPSVATFNEPPAALTTGEVNETPAQTVSAPQTSTMQSAANQDQEIKDMQPKAQSIHTTNETYTHHVAAKKHPIEKHILAKHKKNHEMHAAKAGEWLVQLGVFSDRKNAMHLVSALRAHHFSVYTRHIKHNHQTLLAVCVGPEKNAHQAQMTQKHLRAEFKINGIIKEV